MDRGPTLQRPARAARAGVAAVACALLTAAGTTPAFAQAPSVGLEPVDQVVDAAEPVVVPAEPVVAAAEPVVAAAEPVVAAAEPVVAAAEPVVAAAEPVVAAAEPVVAAAEPVVAAAEPVVDAAERVAEAAGPVVEATNQAAAPVLEATGRVVDAAAPVLAATGRVVDAAAPVLAATEPLGEAIAPVVQLPGSVLDEAGGTLDAGGLAGRQGRDGGPHGASPPGTGRHGTESGATHSPGRAPSELAPVAEVFPSRPADPTAPTGAHAHGAPLDSSGRSALPQSRPTPGALPAPGLAATPADLPEFMLSPSSLAARAAHPAASSSDAERSSPGGGGAPSPSSPVAGAGASAASGFSTAPVFGLLFLFVLAVPSLSRFLRTVPAFLRPTPFICALERPG
jgi:hypothetical protein